jgi:hypothetical protein
MTRVIRGFRSIDAPLDGLRQRDGNAGHVGELRPGTAPRYDRQYRGILRDEASGEELNAVISGPLAGRGYGPELPPAPRAGDRAFAAEQDPDPFSDCARIREWQRALNEHYRRV